MRPRTQHYNRSLLLLALAGLTQLTYCTKEVQEATSNEIIASAARPGGGGEGSVTRYPLFIPTAVSGTSLTLTAAPGTHNLGNASTNVWEYNGSVPGPTIVANKGDNVSITYNNELPEPSIIHWHGMLVDHTNDGQPMQVVPAGGTYSYTFPIINRAALNWYHPHPHMTIGKQVYNGLAGAFIIRDAEEGALNLPSAKYEVPLVFRDITLDKKGQPVYNPTGGGYFGKTPLVNGTRDPYLAVDKAVYRFRVLIGSTSRVFNLALSNGAPFTLIGNDGGLLPQSSTHTAIEVCPGERLDLLVDFRNVPTNSKIMLKDLASGWDLLEFRVTETSVAYSGPLTTASSITALSNPVLTRTFSFDGMGKINGLPYDMDAISFEVPFDQTEKWVFKTNGNGPHPVHVHGASFQVINRTGGRGQLFAWEAGWKDVVLVNDAETVEVLIRFDAYRGDYVMHCHKLEHEDNGMMLNFRVK